MTGPGRWRTYGTVVLALVIVTVAALAPPLAGAQAANELPVTEVSQSDGEAMTRPTAPEWNDVVPDTVPLASAPSTAPNANDTTMDAVRVRVARTTDRLYVRLSWDDATADGNLTDSPYNSSVDSYADAAAIQLPANASAQPGIAMGDLDTPVNVWWWGGAVGGQELLAGGPGTTTQFPESTVTTNATYSDGGWHVVFSRELVVDDGVQNRTAIELDEDVDVAFAVWNGSNDERAGRKAVSEWHHFPFGPEPQGPPYETALWAVAGAAIVVVVVVTTLAVQRGG